MRTTVMAMLCAAAYGSPARAEILHFVNPAPEAEGHYDWRWIGGVSWESWLDITRPPSDQPNTLGGSAVGQTGDLAACVSWRPRTGA